MEKLCLNFKISKSTLQRNQSYYRPRIQNPVKHLRWSLQEKMLMAFSH